MTADEARAFDAERERSPELQRAYDSLAEVVDLLGEVGRTDRVAEPRVDTPPSAVVRRPDFDRVVGSLRRVAVAAVVLLAAAGAVWWVLRDASPRESEPNGSSVDVASTDASSSGVGVAPDEGAPSDDVAAALWIARSDPDGARDGEPVDASTNPLVIALPSEHEDVHIFWVYETGTSTELGLDRGKETGT